MPWETPITAVYGRPLQGMALGVGTELAVARAVDEGDPVTSHLLPARCAALARPLPAAHPGPEAYRAPSAARDRARCPTTRGFGQRLPVTGPRGARGLERPHLVIDRLSHSRM